MTIERVAMSCSIGELLIGAWYVAMAVAIALSDPVLSHVKWCHKLAYVVAWPANIC